MNNQLEKLSKDLEKASNYELPETEGIEEKVLKCQPAHGMRIGWYYMEDLDFYRSEKVNPREYSRYTGLLVLRPDAEHRGSGSREIEDLVLIVDGYPCEKCYPEVDYIAFAAFLNDPNLVEVYQEDVEKRLKLESPYECYWRDRAMAAEKKVGILKAKIESASRLLEESAQPFDAACVILRNEHIVDIKVSEAGDMTQINERDELKKGIAELEADNGK